MRISDWSSDVCSSDLALAQEAGMDLVEIQPNGDPPVCRIMDYGKFKFEAQKKAQAAKKKQKQVEIKEVKFRPVTDVGDYQIKQIGRASCREKVFQYV